jgi:hypothetical protein
MKVSEIERRVFSHLRDAGKTFVEYEDFLDWLNDAYVDIVSRLRLIQTEKTGTFADATGILDFSTWDPELVQVDWMRIAGTDVEWRDSDDWNRFSDDGAAPSVILGREYALKLEFTPAPASGTAYTVRYYSSPPALVERDETPNIPTHLHRKLVAYCVWQAKLKLGYDDEALTWQADYERNLPEPLRGRLRLRPGGGRWVRNAPGPFDKDPDRSHV